MRNEQLWLQTRYQMNSNLFTENIPKVLHIYSVCVEICKITGLKLLKKVVMNLNNYINVFINLSIKTNANKFSRNILICFI